jgi:hypothetical protein
MFLVPVDPANLSKYKRGLANIDKLTFGRVGNETLWEAVKSEARGSLGKPIIRIDFQDEKPKKQKKG